MGRTTAGGSTALLATAASPWGPVHVVGSRYGIAAVERGLSAEVVAARIGERIGEPVEVMSGGRASDLRSIEPGLRAVAAAVAGHEPPPDLLLDWRGVSDWDRRVLEGARTLGRAEITSYGRLARRIGAPGAARAVGSAMGRNPFWLLIPCHRVVAGDGSIGGYGGGPDALEVKRDLLALEGISVPVVGLID